MSTEQGANAITADIEATIAITADWLCTHTPVVFTGRTHDQPKMADPFPIYQQVVKDNEAFFHDVYGYVPSQNTKTGLAGVRSRVYTQVWRDHVILPALRIYRARTEGASLDAVPEVTFSVKPSCDGRADKSVAQRGIMGFEPSAARKGYVYNPDRNPNLLDMPPVVVPMDGSLIWEADVCDLEGDYYSVLKAHVVLKETPPTRRYMCRRCGVPKKGHICLKAAPSKKRKSASVQSAVKWARK